MSDWKNRTTQGTAVAGIALIVIFLSLAFSQCSKADPLPEMNIVWVRYTTYQEVHQECQARNGSRIANSSIPSCFLKDGLNHCIIIAKVPDNEQDDYAARDFIGREAQNCTWGHRFPVNPE